MSKSFQHMAQEDVQKMKHDEKTAVLKVRVTDLKEENDNLRESLRKYNKEFHQHNAEFAELTNTVNAMVSAANNALEIRRGLEAENKRVTQLIGMLETAFINDNKYMKWPGLGLPNAITLLIAFNKESAR